MMDHRVFQHLPVSVGGSVAGDPVGPVPTPTVRQEGDRVLEVNGTQGSSIEMAKILRQAPFIKTLRGSFLW